jgi:hypothetical protein
MIESLKHPMSKTRRSFLMVGLRLILALPPVIAQAQDAPLRVEGQAFERRVRVGGAELLLNGTGVRAVAWFKGYVAGLYLGRHAGDAEAVLATAGPKRLQLRMLQEVPAAEFVKAFKKGVERNADAAELPHLAERMERFEALIAELGTVHKGDLINLDLEPGRGTVFSLNGTLRGDAIAGDDFYAALLRSFVGEHPYDTKLKAGLLGQR